MRLAPGVWLNFTFFRIAVSAAALAGLCSAAARAGDEAFVNIAGYPPQPFAAVPAGTGDPQIEKLLTRPADLWERLRQGFAIPDLDSRLVAVHEAWYAARP